MPKRKVYVEAIVEGIIDQNDPKHHDDNVVLNARVKHYKVIFPIDFEYKNKADVGGEAWDWAQSNWPEFIPEDYPFPLVDQNGNTVMVMGKLRWACITCVYNKKGDPLPVAHDHGKESTKKTKKKAPKTKAKKATPKVIPVISGDEFVDTLKEAGDEAGGLQLTVSFGGHPSAKGARKAAKDKPVDKVLAQAAAAVEDRTTEAVKKATRKGRR